MALKAMAARRTGFAKGAGVPETIFINCRVLAGPGSPGFWSPVVYADLGRRGSDSEAAPSRVCSEAADGALMIQHVRIVPG